MKEIVHFLRGVPGGGPGGCPGASAPQNVVFPMVLKPRDSKMLYFLSFWSLEILKCCISLAFGASRFGNVAFVLILECDGMEIFEKYEIHVFMCFFSTNMLRDTNRSIQKALFFITNFEAF